MHWIRGLVKRRSVKEIFSRALFRGGAKTMPAEIISPPLGGQMYKRQGGEYHLHREKPLKIKYQNGQNTEERIWIVKFGKNCEI